jgi:protein SCO1/2
VTQLLLKRRFWFWVLTMGTAAVIFLSLQISRSAAPQELPVYGQIPDFQLTERSGQSAGLKDLLGKIWIADFIFTRCMGPCPLMSSRMRMIQEKVKERTDIKLISFSVDPDYDTPERLQAYAERFGARSGQWLFLTGDKAQIHKLSQQHFHLGVSDIPEAEREAPDQTVSHSSKFVLVDAQGRIRGYYASDELGFLDKLMKDLKTLEVQ